jgi:DNA-binding winged helix-turn-helix (wHTH) protein/predicted ATPase
MPAATYLCFGSYRLDLENECLWRGTQVVPLRPKPFAVLRYLVEHAGRLVAKAELLHAVWPETVVSTEVLKGYIHDLRTVLGEEAEAPRFIETVARRGYRFIAPLTTSAPPVSSSTFQVSSLAASPAPSSPPRASLIVGREAELRQLQSWFEQALGGKRQVVCVTGEAGIGKTTVVEAFLERAVRPRGCWLGQGQCIEHFGAGEAYLPMLAALGQLCRAPGHERFREFLEQQAPTWLAQMPTLLSAAEQEALQRRTLGATRERMLRELAEALEQLTAAQPLVLVLEDLHWSDYATLDFLAFVARRREPARLLVIGTYRPAEVILRDHPLKRVKQELQLHGQCQELALELLPKGAVVAYLAARFPGHQVRASLVQSLYQRTDGNPLFLVTMVEEMVAQGLLVSAGQELVLNAAATVALPASLQQMLESQLERLPAAEQQVLEAASVAGAEFSPAAVAAGLAAPVEEVEQRCAVLARRGQFVRAIGTTEWPDETVATRYRFLHTMYQEVLSAHVTAAQQVSLHRRIGEREEQAYGARTGEIAAELAVHFEQGRDYQRAVQYLQQAGQRASQRSAHVEAITHLTKGLELLKTLPDTPARTQQELDLQITLGPTLLAAKGPSAPEVESTYTRARELCQQVGETPQLFRVLFGLRTFYHIGGQFLAARELGEQMLALAQRGQQPALLLGAHRALGSTVFHLGELAAARVHLEQSIALYDPQQHRSHVFLYGTDPGVFGLSYAAWVLWGLGSPDQGLQRSQEAVALARGSSHPWTLASALFFAAWFHQFRRERQATQERAEAAMTLATELGFPYWLVSGTILRGWALAEQGQGAEGIVQMRQGLAAWRAMGAELFRPNCLALLAEAYGKTGQAAEGLTVLTEALAVVDKNEERFYQAEIYRLKGQLTLQQSQLQSSKREVKESRKSRGKGRRRVSGVASQESEAEGCFRKAIEVARTQQAKSWELRAVMSLSRLWQQQGKKEKAREMLAEIYNWFTEGFDTKDLQEAKALLKELS